MNTGGLVLTLLTLLIIVAMIIGNKYIKKITNCYFFWLILAGFWFAWLIAFRFIPDWVNYIENIGSVEDPGEYSNSVMISRAFLFDVCPFFALALLFSLMVDPSRKIARAISPIALIGGAITVVSVSFDSTVSGELSAEFIFFGFYPNSCYFIMHFLQVVFAIGVMLNTPSGGWKNWLATLLVILIYYVYVVIGITATGCKYNTSGVSILDWIDGEYHFVSEIFHISPEVCHIIGIPTLALVGCGIIAIKDYVFNRGHWLYGNAYSGKWYCWYNYNKFVKQGIL